MDSKQTEISFIIVNYQSREHLARCLASIQKLVEINAEIIIVNNDSLPLESSFSDNFQLKIIQAPKNMGFGSGVNLGAHSASGKYLFLINPDAEIVSASLQKISREFEQNKNLAILGAKIIDERDEMQAWIAGESITPWRIIKNNLGLSQDQAIQKQKNNFPVDWVSGGAMLIHKDLFQKVGGFDEKIFLYYEDIDLCRRVKKLGFDILYFPTLIVRHSGGKSFTNKTTQKKYYYQSQEYYFQKHFGKLAGFLMKWLQIIFHPNL